MSNVVDSDVVKNLKSLSDTDDLAKRLFEFLSARKNDTADTAVMRIRDFLKITYNEALSLSKKLEETGCGKVIPGKNGKGYRFYWYYSLRSVGKVAIGCQTSFDKIFQSNTNYNMEFEKNEVMKDDVIVEAKKSIARAFNVPISSIEIKITI